MWFDDYYLLLLVTCVEPGLVIGDLSYVSWTARRVLKSSNYFHQKCSEFTTKKENKNVVFTT